MDHARSYPRSSYPQDVDDPETPEAPADAFREAMSHFGELKAYASQFVSAKADGVRLTARKIAVYAVLGLVGLLAGATAVVVAVALLLGGLAGVIAAALGGRMWAGDLIVGGGLFLLLGVGAWLGMRWFFKSSRKRTVDRYERSLQRQRVEYGCDARQRSAEYAAAQHSEGQV